MTFRLRETRKMMVRVTNWVGDAVMSLPALQHLRRALPDAEIVLVARPWVADLYTALAAASGVEALANRILVYDPGKGRGPLVKELRSERFDSALLLPNSFDAAWVAWRAGIPERCGYARDGRSPLLTRAVPPPREGEIPPHQAYYYLELLRRLGLVGLAGALPALDGFGLSRPPGAREKARERLRTFGSGAVGTVVGLNPGAAFGTAKRWLPRRYSELGRRLRDEAGAEIVLFGAEPERLLAESIAGEIGKGAVSTAGRTTLVDFLALVAGVDLFITNDTGTMHLAAAAGIPVLALFGPTDERATAPLGSRARLLKKPVPCSPCLLRNCPVDHRCMSNLSVQEVFETACQMIPTVRPSSSTVTAH